MSAAAAAASSPWFPIPTLNAEDSELEKSVTQGARTYLAQHVGVHNLLRHGSRFHQPADRKAAERNPVPPPNPPSPSKGFGRNSDLIPDTMPNPYSGGMQQRMPHAGDPGVFLNSTSAAASMIESLPAVMAGFYFKRRRERLNWKLLASLNVDQITKEVDIKSLQEMMENLTFCDIEAEDRYADPNFIKLIQLSQLTIEYLLHCQNYLLDQRQSLAGQTEALNGSVVRMRAENAKQSAEIQALRKETRVLRKSMYAYQLMTKMPGELGPAAAPPPPKEKTHPTTYYRCPFCPKMFVNHPYVESHVQRRHGDMPQSQKAAPKAEQPKQPPAQPTMEEIMAGFDKVSGRIGDVEKQLREEMEAKVANEMASRQKALDDALAQEKLRFEQELQHLRTTATQERERERLELEEAKSRLRSDTGKKDVDDDKEEEARRLERERVQKDIDDLKRAVAGSQSGAQTGVNAHLSKAASQIEALQKALEDERNENDELSRRQTNDCQRHVQEMRDLETKRAADAARIAKLQGSLETLKTRLDQGSGLPQGGVQAFAYTDSDSGPELVTFPAEARVKKNQPLTWDRVEALMKEHKETPIPTSSWLKTMYPHDPAMLTGQRNDISAAVDHQLSKLGINAPDVYAQWGIEETHRDISTLLDTAQANLDRRQAEAATKNPLYARMRAWLEETVDDVAKGHRGKRGLKPPPIVTDAKMSPMRFEPHTPNAEERGRKITRRGPRQDRPRRGRATTGPPSAVPGSARGLSLAAGSRGGVSVDRGRLLLASQPRGSVISSFMGGAKDKLLSTFKRDPGPSPYSAMAPTPTVGGMRFPSLKRAKGGQEADVNWDDEGSSDYSGSDATASSPVRRTQGPQRAPSPRKSSRRRNFERQLEAKSPHSARSTRENMPPSPQRGRGQSKHPPAGRPRVVMPPNRRLSISVPPSPNKLKEGFSRLTRALSFTRAQPSAADYWGRKASMNGSPIPPSPMSALPRRAPNEYRNGPMSAQPFERNQRKERRDGPGSPTRSPRHAPYAQKHRRPPEQDRRKEVETESESEEESISPQRPQRSHKPKRGAKPLQHTPVEAFADSPSPSPPRGKARGTHRPQRRKRGEPAVSSMSDGTRTESSDALSYSETASDVSVPEPAPRYRGGHAGKQGNRAVQAILEESEESGLSNVPRKWLPNVRPLTRVPLPGMNAASRAQQHPHQQIQSQPHSLFPSVREPTTIPTSIPAQQQAPARTGYERAQAALGLSSLPPRNQAAGSIPQRKDESDFDVSSLDASESETSRTRPLGTAPKSGPSTGVPLRKVSEASIVTDDFDDLDDVLISEDSSDEPVQKVTSRPVGKTLGKDPQSYGASSRQASNVSATGPTPDPNSENVADVLKELGSITEDEDLDLDDDSNWD
ncbi:uncharacterized protein EV422DRAFT_566237 [Fimicolochytrium jonesii]|uniref:uncharacterized protein n=1 Tax=Fimicolochytrium jonesii TaxID=1396493 RepID=UPI0022FF3EA9|nr:uncharacterized protein EV422DRAFT_566237 [Fimicolochytrium jonesii]KAI8822558.1 hypothetical protein EV422DRAFT_566237 [Fimicolochytrium jonesii]